MNTLTVVVNGLVSSKDGVSVSLINAREKDRQGNTRLVQGVSRPLSTGSGIADAFFCVNQIHLTCIIG